MSQVEWIKAYRKAQAEFPPIGKDTSVTIKTEKGNYSYKYAALPDILDAIGEALDSNGLTIAQSVNGDGNVVAVETRIYHDGGWVEVFGPLALKVAGDAKAAGSAITYARRYALCAALGIAPDEDDDGEKASQPSPQRTDTKMSGADWLAGAIQMFGLWTLEQRKDAGTAAMKELGLKNPLSLDDAKAVKEKMDAAYYVEFPGQSPF